MCHGVPEKNWSQADFPFLIRPNFRVADYLLGT